MRDRNSIPILSLVVLALVPAVLLAGVWQIAEANEPPVATTTTTTLPPGPPASELTTELLSFRRDPDPLAEQAAAAETERQLAAWTSQLTSALPGSGSGAGGRVGSGGGCLTMRRGDEIITQVRGDVGLLPASNMKLLVAAVALDVLGPDFRFRTELRSAPVEGGVVPGDVYVVGGGDPVLVTADHVDTHPYPAVNTTALEPLIDQLGIAGVTSIAGDIVGDASRYDDEFRVPAWGDEVTNAEAGPYDALLVNDGLIGNGNYGLVPAQSAANIIDDLIRASGIHVAGSSRHAPVPDDAQLTTLAIIESAPLTEVLVELLHTSDNNTAELLLKEIGYQASGEGTRAAGAATIGRHLAAWGIASPVAVLDDGSGLSRNNQLTCGTLSGVLAVTPVASDLRDLLPVAGRDGTLADEFLGSPAEGELQAKTGTLSGVKALTGVMDADDGAPVEFALLLNGSSVDDPAVYEPYWRAVVDAIAEYPVVVEPDPEAFAPR